MHVRGYLCMMWTVVGLQDVHNRVHRVLICGACHWLAGKHWQSGKHGML